MAIEHQLGQLCAVIDIREQRLERALTQALTAKGEAEIQLQATFNAQSHRASSLAEASIDFIRNPASEPTRIWRDLCHERLMSANDDVDTHQCGLDDALEVLMKAQHDMRQMKERGKHIGDLRIDVRRDIARTKAIRSEDDSAAQPCNPLMTGNGCDNAK